MYLATVIDLASRRLAGWTIADHMQTELVTDALTAAEMVLAAAEPASTVFLASSGSSRSSISVPTRQGEPPVCGR
ncbi:hypothetical protein [Streptomyces sp. NPDC001292]|uniref:hypothetical protein n=1 Tax=Streptomyces sp. NPDC001292 TaxID=3364558 RepID=UPI0036A541AD